MSKKAGELEAGALNAWTPVQQAALYQQYLVEQHEKDQLTKLKEFQEEEKKQSDKEKGIEEDVPPEQVSAGKVIDDLVSSPLHRIRFYCFSLASRSGVEVHVRKVCMVDDLDQELVWALIRFPRRLCLSSHLPRPLYPLTPTLLVSFPPRTPFAQNYHTDAQTIGGQPLGISIFHFLIPCYTGFRCI